MHFSNFSPGVRTPCPHDFPTTRINLVPVHVRPDEQGIYDEAYGNGGDGQERTRAEQTLRITWRKFEG
jgi:hypothetical protein